MTLLPADLRPHTAFDLHLHTSASDGRHPLEEVLRRCAANGLDVVAITDHDLALELRGGPHTIDGRVLHVLPGAEISGMHEGREFHLLVYFPRCVPEAFRTFCAEQCQIRRDRYAATLVSLDLVHPPEKHTQALTRLHLAHALIEAGRVGSKHEAFQRFLGHEHGHVPLLQLPFVEAIRIARAHGGVTSWAHPPRKALEAHLEDFVAAGLQGLEGLRPMMGSTDRNVVKKLARRHGLFLTGGSDWHGWSGDSPGLFRVDAERLTGFIDTLSAT